MSLPVTSALALIPASSLAKPENQTIPDGKYFTYPQMSSWLAMMIIN